MSDVLWSRDRPQRVHIGAGGGVLRRCPRAKGRPQKQAASGTPTNGCPPGRRESRPTLNGVHALGRRNWPSEPTSAARAARIRATCAHYETAPHTRYTQLM